MSPSHNPSNRQQLRVEVLTDMVAPVDVARGVYIRMLQQMPLSEAERARRISRYDQDRAVNQHLQSLDRDDLFAIKALALLAGKEDCDVHSLLAKTKYAEDDALSASFSNVLLSKGQFSSHLSKAKEALEKYTNSVKTFLADPVIQQVEGREFSEEELIAALRSVGAKSETTVYETNEDEDSFDFGGVGVEVQGHISLQMILHLIRSARSFADSKGLVYQSVLQSLERVVALRSAHLETRIIADLKGYIHHIATSPNGDKEVAEEWHRINLGEKLFQSTSQRMQARWEMSILVAVPEHLATVVDAYEVLVASKALGFFQYYPSHDSSDIFIATALSQRVAALDRLGLKLSSILELYRSTADSDKLEILEIFNAYPRLIDVYHSLPPGLRRSDFTSLIVQISRLDAVVALTGEESVLGRFLTITAAQSDKAMLDTLLKAPASFWTNPLVEQIASGPWCGNVKQLAASVLVSCDEGARPNRLRLFDQLLTSEIIQLNEDEVRERLVLLSRSSETSLERVKDISALSQSSQAKKESAGGEKGKTTASRGDSNRAVSWLKAIADAVEAGRIEGISSDLLAHAVSLIPENFLGRIGYLATLHPHSLPVFLNLSSRYPLFAQMFSKDMELLVGFAEAVKASSPSAVIATVEEILAEDPQNPYSYFQQWLGSMGSRNLQSRQLFSISAPQMAQFSTADRQFSKVFFVGGQHSVEVQEEIVGAAQEGIDVRFYHGLSRTPLDLGSLDSDTLVVCLTRSLSHSIHDRVKQAVNRAGGRFCYLTKTGVASTKELIRNISPPQDK